MAVVAAAVVAAAAAAQMDCLGPVLDKALHIGSAGHIQLPKAAVESLGVAAGSPGAVAGSQSAGDKMVAVTAVGTLFAGTALGSVAPVAVGSAQLNQKSRSGPQVVASVVRPAWVGLTPAGSTSVCSALALIHLRSHWLPCSVERVHLSWPSTPVCEDRNQDR